MKRRGAQRKTSRVACQTEMERASEGLKLEMQLLCKPGSAHCAPLSGHANTYHSFKSPSNMQHDFWLQLELHTVARLDKGGSTDSETLPHEVWSWTLGANSRYRPPSRQTHPAAERANATVDRTTIAGRYGKLPGNFYAVKVLNQNGAITTFLCLQPIQVCR